MRAGDGRRRRRVHDHQRADRERFGRRLGIVQRAARDDGRVPGALVALRADVARLARLRRRDSRRAGVGSRSAAAAAGRGRARRRAGRRRRSSRSRRCRPRRWRRSGRVLSSGRFYDIGADLHHQMVALLGSGAAIAAGDQLVAGRPGDQASQGSCSTVVGIVSAPSRSPSRCSGSSCLPYVAERDRRRPRPAAVIAEPRRARAADRPPRPRRARSSTSPARSPPRCRPTRDAALPGAGIAVDAVERAEHRRRSGSASCRSRRSRSCR